MKTFQYLGLFDETELRSAIIATFPAWHVVLGGTTVDHFGTYYNPLTNVATLYVPDDGDEDTLLQMLIILDPAAAVYSPTAWEDVILARQNFLNLPNWATWTAEQAQDFVVSDILSGMTKEEIEAWIDANVTTLATAKTALKLVGGELVDLREICSKIAMMLVYLRDIAVSRRE